MHNTHTADENAYSGDPNIRTFPVTWRGKEA
jgi:hypothetical protein